MNNKGSFILLEKKFRPLDKIKKLLARRELKPQGAKHHQLNFLTGFTLIELIFALLILSVIALIIGVVFRLGIDAWERGEAETVETQRLRALSGIIYQNLKSAYPYEMEIDGEKVVIFEGEKNSIMFVTAIADSTTGGLKWVRYSYNDRLFTFNEGILPDKEFFDKISQNEEIIASDIGEVKFEYLSSSEDQWKESWSLGEQLPTAVRVKITYFQPFLIIIPLGLEGNESDEYEMQ